jgi:hypothetical protein
MTTGHDFAQQADRLRQQEFARLADALPPTLAVLRSLTPGPFGAEEVGSMFERLGYTVITHATARDFVMTKEGSKYLVACALPAHVEPTRMQELARLHSAITAASAKAGYYVTTRSFTPDAQVYAATAPIELIDGEKLVVMMQESKAGAILPETYNSMCRQCGALVQHRLDQADAVPCAQGHLVAPTIARAALVGPRVQVTAAACTVCGSAMCLKEGKHGKFWGCSGFPACRNTKPYIAPKARRGYRAFRR